MDIIKREHPLSTLRCKYSAEDLHSLQKDRNNCSVIALSVVMNVGYSVANNLAKLRFDREYGKGAIGRNLINGMKMWSSAFHPVPVETLYPQGKGVMAIRSMTVKTFVKKYPTGRYYLLVRSHALSVVDGVIMDHIDKASRRVRLAWKYEPNMS